MGCVTSKKDINDINPHIFQVENVDELGNSLSAGQLEINETELVLYQGDKPPVRWPLKSLRRYGYDKEYFSFEAGRRCPTGSGVYAFNCRRAEKLFNFVQAYVQVGGESDREGGTPLLQVEPYYLEPRSDSAATTQQVHPASGWESVRPRRLSLRNNSSRLSSVTSSNGCTSPSTPNYINDDAFRQPLSEEPEGMLKHGQRSYENVDLPPGGTVESGSLGGGRVYMNVDVSRTCTDISWLAGDITRAVCDMVPRMSVDMSRLEDDNSPQHCYANLTLGADTPAAAGTRLLLSQDNPPPSTLPLLPYSFRQVNYAVLDLDQHTPAAAGGVQQELQESAAVTGLAPPSPTESSAKQMSDGYVTIDFDRTVALSQSVSSSLAEGVRKTRHDSTVTMTSSFDLVTPTSSRHSACCLSD